MTIVCLLGGCSWERGSHAHFSDDDVLYQSCSRCGAHRYFFGVPAAAATRGLDARA
ncbi:PSPA7_2676 family Cys-rich small protein [Pseudomonas borbori]